MWTSPDPDRGTRTRRSRLSGGMLALAAIACNAHAAPVSLRITDPAGQPLADTVVFLESAQARSAVRPLPAAEMSQIQREFRPQVLVVPTGTPVDFPNRDTVRHHVYSFSPNKRFELKLYIGKPEAPVVFDRAGIAVLGCNIHDQMVGWVVVVDTPYYSRTGPDGRVELDAPAGTYQLRLWHPDMLPGTPAASEPLTVTAQGVNGVRRLNLR